MFFMEAKPVWARGREKEINLNLKFKTVFRGGEVCVFKVTASCLYRAWLNGKFLGYGPARAAHGYFRVDEYKLEGLLEENVLEIEVAGYNTKSFYTLDQPSFLQAEVVGVNGVIVATGNGDQFVCTETDRLQKVLRFSYQRSFTEYYVNGIDHPYIETAVVTGGKLLSRGVDYPNYDNVTAKSVEQGTYAVNADKADMGINRINTNPSLKIYPIEELEKHPVEEINSFEYTLGCKNNEPLKRGEYRVYKFNNSETGFIGLKFKASGKCSYHIVFDEVDFRTDPNPSEPINVSYFRNDTYNIISGEYVAGEYDFLSFEAYTANYVKVIVTGGEMSIEELYLKKFEHNFFSKYTFDCSDEKIKEIVIAAARTYAHNAVDLPTDCPSRERAGWLCDSYFSSKSERFFTGKNTVERNFLENYALAPKLENVPEGMIGMCYPADFESEIFIPNWSMWYMVELKDYLVRTGDRSMIDMSRSKVDGLLKYFARFENSDGLLEDLENWVFVEWSKANDADFICGVNYPSNMLYAAALDCVADLYPDLSGLKEKAEKIREVIRRKSFNGKFFEDNAKRENGELKRTGHTTETCQYYAFYFNIATPQTHEELFNVMLNDFGPNRNFEVTYPTVYKSNAFIGNYLRLEILLREGYKKKLLQESVDYFYKMAATTGTLWEHDQIFASLNHGFSSYIAYLVSCCI